MTELTPSEIVAELDRYIVGQKDAKRAIAIAVRNRWRRLRLEDAMRDEVSPKNIMMIGSTGVGKTEIARRLAKITGAPFLKVSATQYSEVGYYGADVDTMAGELVDRALELVRNEQRASREAEAMKKTEERILDELIAKFTATGRDGSEFLDEDEVGAELDDDDDDDDETNDPVRADSSNDSTPNDSDDLEEEDDEDDSEDDGDSDDELEEEDEEDDEEEEDSEEDSDSNRVVVNERRDSLSSSDLSRFMSVVANMRRRSDDEEDDEDDKDDKEKSPLEKLREDVLKWYEKKRRQRLLERLTRALHEGKLENEQILVDRSPFSILGISIVDPTRSINQKGLRKMAKSIKKTQPENMTVADARKFYLEEELANISSEANDTEEAIKLAEELGIIFIDEIDKIVGSGNERSADVSRQGVQRDLIPIVEGTTIQTKYGPFSTKHVLFIGAGAFHKVKPSDLAPELQGRFPLRVELTDLTKEDYVRILTEPANSLIKQYIALMKTENIELVFTDDAIDTLAQYASDANLSIQNIGARRLFAIMERLLEDLSFETNPSDEARVVSIDATFVRDKLSKLVQNEDLCKFVL